MSRSSGRGERECELTRWLCAELERANAVTIALVGHEMQRAGLPDRYVCHSSWRGWVEFKRNDGAVSAAQRVVLQRLLDRGDHVLVGRFLPTSNFLAFERVPPIGCREGAELYRADLREVRAMRAPGVGILAALCESWRRYERELALELTRRESVRPGSHRGSTRDGGNCVKT